MPKAAWRPVKSVSKNDTDYNGISDGNEDTDGDGFTNVEEIKCGSYPADPNSKCPKGLPWLIILLE